MPNPRAIATQLRLQNQNYPADVQTAANQQTLKAIRTFGCTEIAEFGILDGDTSIEIARHLNGRGTLHLFDFQHNVDLVLARLRTEGFANVRGYGSSTKVLDSYNWSLGKIIERTDKPIFDYAFIDGAHTWNVDALAFFLVDRLLMVGGFIDFDDYDWSLRSSPTLAPERFPKTEEYYTEEQVNDRQIKRVVDLLVRRDDRYVQVVDNKLFRKIA